MAFYHRWKRQLLSRVYLVRLLLALLVVTFLAAFWSLAGRPLTSLAGRLWVNLRSTLPSHAGRTNFLLLGVPGDDRNGHAGSDLTDTLVFASVDQSGGDTLLLTIPRDLWILSLRAKINTAYHYGQARQPAGGGLVLAKAAVSEALDQPVDFAMVINFTGFEKIIDLLGGVEIVVERAFDDYRFPVPGREEDPCDGDPQYRCRFEHLHFDAGLQHMDGQRALKFIRSRNAQGEEGTDFARSRRQEKLILALTKQLTRGKTLLHPGKIRQLAHQLAGTVVTDLTPADYPALIKLGLKASRQDLRTAVVAEPLVYNPPLSAAQDFQWVLLPQDNDPQILFSYVKDLLAKPVEE